jgi:hypothetical protein
MAKKAKGNRVAAQGIRYYARAVPDNRKRKKYPAGRIYIRVQAGRIHTFSCADRTDGNARIYGNRYVGKTGT